MEPRLSPVCVGRRGRSGMEAALPWWLVAAVAVPTSGLAAWTGARIGRRQGVRDAVLEPGETVTGTYTVRPPHTGHTPPAAHEGPQYQLRLTTRGMQLKIRLGARRYGAG
ncbi:hypothetical protein ABT237_24675 [Streptomyces sp. NPDC001581]|uniref:hypothetical protein n=1 Tax=Streptomyces sp. NPDC001581 TaxID=3154386 RepID=UPI00331FC7D6